MLAYHSTQLQHVHNGTIPLLRWSVPHLVVGCAISSRPQKEETAFVGHDITSKQLHKVVDLSPNTYGG